MVDFGYVYTCGARTPRRRLELTGTPTVLETKNRDKCRRMFDGAVFKLVGQTARLLGVMILLLQKKHVFSYS